jgi:hypothetical protein
MNQILLECAGTIAGLVRQRRTARRGTHQLQPHYGMLARPVDLDETRQVGAGWDATLRRIDQAVRRATSGCMRGTQREQVVPITPIAAILRNLRCTKRRDRLVRPVLSCEIHST